MKNLKRILLTSVLLLSTILIINCSTEESNLSEKTIKVKDFQKIGEMHNLFLTNVKNEFKPLENIKTLDEKINYVNNFNRKFVNSLDISVDEKQILSEGLENNKSLMFEDNLIKKAFGNKSSKSSSNSSDINLIDMINDLKKNNQINETSYEILYNISKDIKDNYDGNLSDSTLKINVENYVKNFNEAGYDINSGEGEMVGVILAISISSIEWWEQNPDTLLNLLKKSPSNMHNKALIAPWLAADVGGAIYGAAAGAIGSYVLNGEVSWKASGWAALAGGIGASTGIAGKIGKWLFG